MIRILGKAASINVRKVLWTCDELGLAYTREDWGAGIRDPQVPEFLSLNPNGLVPVVVIGDLVLWESNTIIRYLAASQAAINLLPADPRKRARVEMWMDWQATDFNASWRYAFQALVRQNPAFTDAAEIAASVAAWSRHVGILEAQLQRTAHVAGDAFTLADVPIGLAVNRWFMTPIPGRAAHPAVSAYYDRLGARAPYQQHGRNGVA